MNNLFEKKEGEYQILKAEHAKSIIKTAKIDPVDNTVIIIADGAAANNQHADKRCGGYAAMLINRGPGGNYTTKTVQGKIPGATNNVAELTAIREAFKSLNRRVGMAIVITDSKYAIGAFNGNKAKVNQKLINDTLNTILAHAHHVEWYHIDGHTGFAPHDYLDELAKDQAGSTYRR